MTGELEVIFYPESTTLVRVPFYGSGYWQIAGVGTSLLNFDCCLKFAVRIGFVFRRV
jgi:hypothetical protein